jgi:hypothetical protein
VKCVLEDRLGLEEEKAVAIACQFEDGEDLLGVKREEWKGMLNSQHRAEMEVLRERVEELKDLGFVGACKE